MGKGACLASTPCVPLGRLAPTSDHRARPPHRSGCGLCGLSSHTKDGCPDPHLSIPGLLPGWSLAD